MGEARPIARRTTYPWQPMTMTWAEVAATVFRHSESWLRDHVPATFPKPHAAYDTFATEAVLAWVRAEWGLASGQGNQNDAETRLLGKLGHGERQSQVSRGKAA